MNDTDFLSLIWTQLIQVSVLIAVVWLLAKLFARQRPHLAHVLWLLVLVKCLTPPVMSSPAGVMSHLKIPQPDWLTIEQAEEVEEVVSEPEPIDLAPDFPREPLPDFQVSDANFEIDDLSRGFVVDQSELPPEFFLEEPLEVEVAETPVALEVEEPPIEVKAEPPVSSILWKIWFASAGFVLLVTLGRVSITLRRVYRNRVETPEDLNALVLELSRQLRLRRKVRILVTAAKVGPAVVGFFRPLLILPEVVTNGRSAHELEPIIAHELLHVKRGDLGIGWLQVLVQSLWWFHPLVWLVNRFLSREAERCCDEAVVAELDCPPATYARCLLNVLEQKRNLTPIPACPGVKPVELTKQRMERIMKLGQGCRKHSPWWCWLVVVLLGVVVLPGEAAKQQEKPSDAQETEESVTEDDSPEIQFDPQDVVEEVPDRDDHRPANDDDAQPKGIHIPIKVYKVSSLLNRLRTEYQLNEEQSIVVLQKLFHNALNQVTTTLEYRPGILPRLFDEVHVTRDGRLIVDAAKEYHEAAKNLIDVWEQHGFSELTINVCVAERVTGFVLPGEERRWGGEVESKALDEVKVRELIEQLQQLEHTRLSFLPKVNVSNGVSFGLSKEVLRPFLTHYENGEPQIESLSDGFRLRLKPVCLVDGQVKLECEVNGAKVLDVVTTLTQTVNGKPVEIQIPDRSTARFSVVGKVRAGETLAIWSPEFQGKHQRVEQLLVFITPQVKEMDRETLLDLIVKNDTPQPKTSSFSPIRPVPAAIARLADDEGFFTHSGDPVTTSPILKHIVTDLRDQKQDYEEKHSQLVEKLNRPFDASYHRVPLKDVLCEINDKTGIIFVANTDEMARAGISLDDPVDFQISGVSLATVLRLVSGQLEYCTLPLQFLEADGKVEPRIYLSTRSDILDVSLALRARLIPVICAPDEFQDPRGETSPTQRKILQKLDEPIAIHFEQTRFTEAMKQIANKLGITVYVDAMHLPEGMESYTPIDFQSAESTTLREDLAKIGSAHGLTFHAEDEVLKVTSTEFYENQIVTMVYSARDLWPENLPQNQSNPRQVVVDHVRKTFAPESWQNSKEFKIVPHEDHALFFVRQRRKVHEEIRNQAAKRKSGVIERSGEFGNFRVSQGDGLRIQIPAMGPVPRTFEWEDLRESPRPVKNDSRLSLSMGFDESHANNSPAQPPAKPAEPQHESGLEISVSFEKVPLKQAIEQICQAGELEVRIFQNDEEAEKQFLEAKLPDVICFENELAEEGISLDTAVTYSCSSEPVLWALQEMLKPCKLGLEVRERPIKKVGELGVVVEIRSQDFLDRAMTTVNYPIGDLLEKDKSLQGVVGVPVLNKIPHQKKLFRAKPRTKAQKADVLIESLRQGLAWDSVRQNEAPQTIKFHEPSEVLVIRCNRAEHHLIGKLLCERRTACGIEAKPVLSDDVQYYPADFEKDDTLVLPRPGTVLETDRVLVRFSGPRESLYIKEPVHGPDKVYVLELPQNQSLKPGKRYFLVLGNDMQVQNHEIDATDATQWTLEFPAWGWFERAYLLKNSLPLEFTDEDLDQAASKNAVTKVFYLKYVGGRTFNISRDNTLGFSGPLVTGRRPTVETIVSTNLDPGKDPIEEAKKRGTILAVLKSQSGKHMFGTGVDSDSGVVGQIVVEEKSDEAQVDPELWKILVEWEQRSRQYKRLSTEHRCFVYDQIFQIEIRSEGTVYYDGQDKWRLDIEPVKIESSAKSQKLSPQGKAYSLRSDQPQIWIRNGNQIAQAMENPQKKYFVYDIPDKIREGSLVDHLTRFRIFGPPGEFLGGLTAKEAVELYQFTISPETDGKLIWMDVLPKTRSGLRYWKHCQVILNRETFLPFAIKILDPAGRTETVYKFSDFKINENVDKNLFNIPQVLKDYQLVQSGEPLLEILSTSNLQPDNYALPDEQSSHPLIDGPGPGVLPRQFPNPVAANQIDTVQLRFVGPKQSHLTIHVPDRLQTRHQLVLPGRKNLAPGQKYGLILDNIPERKVESEWPVPYRHDPKFYWTLEIPEWNELTKTYLDHNSIPLDFTDEDLDQVAGNNVVTKVVYLPKPANQELAIDGVETIVSTRLDPGVDPVDAAKKRGTIVAVLRSHTGKLMFGTGVNSESGVSGIIIKVDSQLKVEPPTPVESKPGSQAQQKPLITRVYPVADLVVPIPGFDILPAKAPTPVGWGKPITGSPISIPGPPHLPLGGPAGPATYSSPEAGDLPLRAQHPAKPPLARSTPKPSCDASPLIELITQTLKAAHNHELPEGTKLYFVQEQLCLVVRATQTDHGIIADLLSDIRRKQGLQVVIDCKVLQLTDEALDGARFGSITSNTEEAAQHVLNVVQGQKGAQIIAAPKLTTFNGIGAQIQISRAVEDKRDVENMHYMIVPTVSSDRRSVDVNFAVNPTSSLDVLSKAKSMTIPDGYSVLIEVTDELIASTKRSGIPEVDKALRDLKKKELGVRTFVLLTPKIIVQEEEEESPGLPPGTEPKENLLNKVDDQVESDFLITVKPVIIIQEEEEELLELPTKKKSDVLMVTPQGIIEEEEEALLGIPE